MEIPRELSELGVRLEKWRRQQQGRRKLPGEIWKQAVELGERYGFGAVANVLRMNPSALRSKSRAVKPAFVEVAVPGLPRGCALELETARGRLRLELGTMPVASIAELVRALTA